MRRQLAHLLTLTGLLLWLAGCGQTPSREVASPSPQVTPAAPEARPTPEAPAPGSSMSRLRSVVLTDDPEQPIDAEVFSPETHGLDLIVSLHPSSRRTDFTAEWTQGGEPVTEPEAASVAPGQRQIRFHLDRPPAGWPEKKSLQVTLRIEDGILYRRSFRFASEAGAHRLPKPRYIRLQDDINASKTRLTYNSTRNDTIFLIVDTSQLEPGTPVRAIWSARSVDKLESGELVGETTVEAPQPDEDALFLFRAPTNGYLPGAYQVDIYFENELVASRNFWITEDKS
ncbi:MAG: hypothetical protein KC910_03040 [Candidatus Eremiobacteraeota bacterium]|nr:hypothetical protein [Candidatus Eremiobacteraeota bacterium]